MKETPLAPFDNHSIFADPLFLKLHANIDEAAGIIIASPIYNWSLGSGAKSIVEATGATGENDQKSAWFDKIVTFICAGGLPHSYMAYGSMAMSLMMDFKCVINPYVVYAAGRDWIGEANLSSELSTRLQKTLDVKMELVQSLGSRSYQSDWEV